jgi:hypothetical protein
MGCLWWVAFSKYALPSPAGESFVKSLLFNKK